MRKSFEKIKGYLVRIKILSIDDTVEEAGSFLLNLTDQSDCDTETLHVLSVVRGFLPREVDWDDSIWDPIIVAYKTVHQFNQFVNADGTGLIGFEEGESIYFYSSY